MANKNQLLCCPFCGSAGEINDGRTYPARCKTFPSKELAEEWIAEMQKKHIIKEFAIIKKHAKSGSRYTARVEIQAFIPRCTKIGCIGRNAMAMFPSKEAAAAAWNTRQEETMKTVLISIHPMWCYKILNWLKLIEVRKSRPKQETPFKCYIYMSSGGWAWRDPFSTAVIPPNGEMYNGSQKVVAEFVCDCIDEYRPDDSPFGLYDISDDVVSKTCLLDGKLWEYGKGKTLYGWHISDLKIYDKPKQLSDFGLSRAPQSWCYVQEFKDNRQ